MPKNVSACVGKMIAKRLNSSVTAAAGPITQRPGPERLAAVRAVVVAAASVSVTRAVDA
ncbi:hypothetical protein [Microbacterium paulum]